MNAKDAAATLGKSLKGIILKPTTLSVEHNLHYCGIKPILITQSECVCSLWNPGCNERAPCYHMWPLRLYRIFPLYLQQHDFRKKESY